MKKWAIWLIAAVMGASFLTLLYLQTRYLRDMVSMRREQFDAAVTRSLAQAARALETAETQARLEKEMGWHQADSTAATADSQPPSLEARVRQYGSKTTLALLDEAKRDTRTDSLRRQLLENYLYRTGVIDDVVLSILYKPSPASLRQRIENLDNRLKQAFADNGVQISRKLDYHYLVTNSNGDTVYVCPDYNPAGEDHTFRQELFSHDPRAKMGVLYVHFPTLRRYIYSSVRFIVPAIVFTFLLLCMFIFTIYTIFRQKRITEMKNDFINNMTHEFKTPISTISLAAQMLQDPSVGKSEKMFTHLSGIISDETKRLRFQVEKVLQMSLFDRTGGTFKCEDTDMHQLIEDVADTFRLKVEASGGTLQTTCEAPRHTVWADPMHMTNVIFNLLDNAVKYKAADRQLQISIHTETRGGKLLISVCDNGIGIRKDDVKKVFERFYRSHTGNRHDVKGFGLGLAYVKQVVDHHHGTIHAESDYGRGTRFIISLPTVS